MSYTASYKPDCLSKIASIKYLPETFNSDIAQISYLDFVLVDPIDPTEPNPFDISSALDRPPHAVKIDNSFMHQTGTDELHQTRAIDSFPPKFPEPVDISRSIEDTEKCRVMALKLYTDQLYVIDDLIYCDDEKEHFGVVVENYFVDKIVEKIIELANNNPMAKSDGLVKLDLSECDQDTAKRRVFARVLSLSNLIATTARRGSANFIIIDEDFIDLFLNKNIYPLIQLEHVYTTYHHISPNIYVSSKLKGTGSILIGRTPQRPDEPGIHLIGKESDFSGELVFNNGGLLSHIKVKYFLSAIGKNASDCYVHLKITK